MMVKMGWRKKKNSWGWEQFILPYHSADERVGVQVKL